MTVNDKTHKLSFEVVDYSCSDCPGADDKDFGYYDANWLIIQVKYKQKGVWLEHTDACLLTNELAELYDEMSKILDGKSACAILEFMEPYIKFALANVGVGYVLTIQHDICDENRHWTTWAATELMDRARFQAVRNEIADMCKNGFQKR